MGRGEFLKCTFTFSEYLEIPIPLPKMELEFLLEICLHLGALFWCLGYLASKPGISKKYAKLTANLAFVEFWSSSLVGQLLFIFKDPK